MVINAYILAADPAWIEAGVLSYYDFVQSIIVSYDEKGIGWTGKPVAVEECLTRLRKIDRDNKLSFSPGHYARLNYKPMENETYQRQCALDQAGKGADWVLQLDADEVLADPTEFQRCLQEADGQGFSAMDYPARFLYCEIGKNWYLEACSRFWRVAAGYPGPVAVKQGMVLRFARQCDAQIFRVDFRKRNTDIWRAHDAPVHKVIPANKGIYHYAWVRSRESMLKKSQTSGHANDMDWTPQLRRWLWCQKYPLAAVLFNPLRRRNITAPFLRPVSFSTAYQERYAESRNKRQVMLGSGRQR